MRQIASKTVSKQTVRAHLRTACPRPGSDTLAAITGSIAEAFYGVPEELRQECRKRLPPELSEILRRWESTLYNEKICGRIEI